VRKNAMRGKRIAANNGFKKEEQQIMDLKKNSSK